jgi:hypothetical protein
VAVQATALLALVSRHLLPLSLFSTGHLYLKKIFKNRGENIVI